METKNMTEFDHKFEQESNPLNHLTERRKEERRKGTTGQEIDPEGINHPSHYNSHPSSIECITIIRDMPLYAAMAIKYLWRAGLKENTPTLKDLKKARWYLDDEIQRLEKNEK